MGLSRHTAEALDEDAHIRQSVADILTTPVGTRVMRRDYGSRLHELVGRPLTPERVVDVYQATAEALAKWEPRIRVRRVVVDALSEMSLSISVIARDLQGREVAALRAEL